jgi:uncharacterized protein (TIGR00369 family)
VPFMSTAPSQADLDRYAQSFSDSLSLKYFGAVVSFPEGKKVRVRIAEVRTEFRGGLGSSAVNGGVLAAMFDLALGCTPALVDPSRRTATVQISMSFMKPVLGDSLVTEAHIDTVGGRTIFSSARILDERGEECAKAQGIVKIAKISWANGESPATN